MSTDVATIEVPPMRSANPMDLTPTEFRSGLQRRKENRVALVEWIKSALVDGVDYGRIHINKQCQNKYNCTNEYHFSKPSLRKPGAEKICGMLGVTATFPTLKDYEAAALEGREIRQIILRCHLIAPTGEIVADGVGARSVEQDHGDLNKALKMTIKSAHIDSTLRMAGLSEIFTQDIEDMPADRVGAETAPQSPPARSFNQPADAGTSVPCGKHKGKAWADVGTDYLDWCIANPNKAPKELQIGAKQELEFRASLKPSNDFDEELPESFYRDAAEPMRVP